MDDKEEEKAQLLLERLAQANPAPKTELFYTNSYTLLVAVVLSAQSTDKGVNKATASLFPQVDTPEKMMALGEENLLDKIRTIGLYKTKAKNIMRLSQLLIENHGGQVPTTREELEALPGVGRKTANVVLNVAFHQPTIPVDTHIFRVAHRTGLSHGKTPEAVERDLERKIPPSLKAGAHHWLILHGRYICRARNPLCTLCPLQDLCDFYMSSSQKETS